ncbi:hypothetical protein Hanom_Chr00s001567g01683941 [Helianthus anomalus]
MPHQLNAPNYEHQVNNIIKNTNQKRMMVSNYQYIKAINLTSHINDTNKITKPKQTKRLIKQINLKNETNFTKTEKTKPHNHIYKDSTADQSNPSLQHTKGTSSPLHHS